MSINSRGKNFPRIQWKKFILDKKLDTDQIESLQDLNAFIEEIMRTPSL